MNYQISQMSFSNEVLLSLKLQSHFFVCGLKKQSSWSCGSYVEITTFLKSTIFGGVVLL